MLSGTSVHVDALMLVTVVVAAMVAATLLVALQRGQLVRKGRPMLPAEDQPPAGLGRLVPVGTQVEEEYRRGVVTLERWLLSHRQAGSGGG